MSCGLFLGFSNFKFRGWFHSNFLKHKLKRKQVAVAFDNLMAAASTGLNISGTSDDNDIDDVVRDAARQSQLADWVDRVEKLLECPICYETLKYIYTVAATVKHLVEMLTRQTVDIVFVNFGSPTIFYFLRPTFAYVKLQY